MEMPNPDHRSHMDATPRDVPCGRGTDMPKREEIFSVPSHGHDHIADSATSRERKRRRTTQDHNATEIGLELKKSAAVLRKDGVLANTLFFPALPAELKRDNQLRSVISAPLEDLKTVQARGKKMAWAKFSSEQDCLAVLFRLKTETPDLKVTLHRPKERNTGSEQNQVSKNKEDFQRMVKHVLASGGLGNTLMFRNLPTEVDCDEFGAALRSSIGRSGNIDFQSCCPLRIRTALSKNGKARNFWVVFAAIEACRSAFSILHLSSQTFRCGKTVRLNAIIHNDATDIDEKKRRQRAQAMENQKGTAGSNESYSIRPKSAVDRLEDFLRQTGDSLVFLRAREA